MSSQWVMLGKFRMVEITVFIVDHADSFHDAPRSEIGYSGERDDFIKTHFLKTEAQSRTRPLLSVSLAPVIERQSPTNLHTRRKGSG
jgi:hypothetical protein